MARVVLRQVSKIFPGGSIAVDCLDLQIEDQELLVLVGPSGCGKSTTLRMIAGLEDPSEGEICIGEQVVTHVAPKDRDIAMVFQNYALYPHMSVYKNIAFGLELRCGGGWFSQLLHRIAQLLKITRGATVEELALRRKNIPEEIEKAAQTLGIEHLLDRMPRQLSGGERQRVALGRAIVRKPAAFLFDEPLSNLDAKLRVEMRREIKQLHRRLQATIVYVTHDQVEALTLGDRVVVMHEGKIQQVGRPMEVYDQPVNRFVAGFIGTPPMNFVEGVLNSSGEGQKRERFSFTGSGIQIELESVKTEKLETRSGQKVVLGFRPEDIQVLPRVESTELSAELPCDASAGAKVSVVESHGDASLLHLELVENSDQPHQANQTIVARAEARTELKSGDSAVLVIDPTRLHLFDTQSGENLTR